VEQFREKLAATVHADFAVKSPNVRVNGVNRAGHLARSLLFGGPSEQTPDNVLFSRRKPESFKHGLPG
jgi:hypothetical protein